jgi:hypothetical protein
MPQIAAALIHSSDAVQRVSDARLISYLSRDFETSAVQPFGLRRSAAVAQQCAVPSKDVGVRGRERLAKKSESITIVSRGVVRGVAEFGGARVFHETHRVGGAA